MAGAFGHADAMRVAPTITLAAGTVEDGMPLSSLTDPQPGMRTRLVGSDVTLVVDLGAASTVGVLLIGNTTLTGAETVALTGSLSDPTGADAGAIALVSASATTPDLNRGQVVILLPADVSVRYLRLEITGISAGFLDVGVLAAMATLRLIHGTGFGAVEGRLALGQRDRNPVTGAEFGVPGVFNPRLMRFTLPTLRAAEYGGTLRDMLGGLSVADDVLWIPETTLAQAELNQRSIYGGLMRPGEQFGIVRDRPLVASASFALVERA